MRRQRHGLDDWLRPLGGDNFRRGDDATSRQQLNELAAGLPGALRPVGARVAVGIVLGGLGGVRRRFLHGRLQSRRAVWTSRKITTNSRGVGSRRRRRSWIPRGFETPTGVTISAGNGHAIA